MYAQSHHYPGAVASSSAFHAKNVGAASNRRDSVASTGSSYSCSGSSSGSSTAGYDSDDTIEEDDEIATPPFLPADSATGAARARVGASYKGKGKAVGDDAFDIEGALSHFSLAESESASVAVEREHVAAVASPAALLPPPSPARLPPPVSAASSPLALRVAPASEPAPPPTSVADVEPSGPPAHVRPLPQPSPPTHAVEEAYRGRSRWPRLLWRSELDMDSLVVLKNYHERAVGQPLPVLKSGMRPTEVAKWSRRMEHAGL